MLNYMHYQKGLVEAGLISAIEAHRQRGQKPLMIKINPANDTGAREVDGVPVEVTNKAKPLDHFLVVV